ncbi:MAG: DUF1624 domain-containing protein [Sphingobacteriia bacterium]|nr:heparan-alpha-glucosaminide N-acetyltransferase domain-containing protein [Paludibacteraceae bacterium]NCA78992.1 DUF1624 domain-containing protein [Sphingobacteriia bacterium]
MAQPTSSRLLSLDVLRGITIAGMITVNNPGSWSHIYAPLKHAAWNGLTPTDLVFPFFMFIMGVSMYLSYKKFDFKFSKQTFFKLLRRSVLLFLIGLGLNYFGLICRGFASLREADMGFGDKLLQVFIYNLEKLRILGVLQRLALVSFFGSLTILLVRPKRIPWLIGGILIVYWVLMVASNSLELTTANWIAVVDNAILGASHMYKMGGIAFDPEGLLSTFPCIAHVLLGVTAGRIIDSDKDNSIRIQRLFIFGTIILFIGYLIDYSFPINKSLWSSSYVLVTCGLASLLLSLLIWIIDINGKRKWCVFFESFGINPMAIFVLAGIISNLLGNIGFTYAGTYMSIKGFIYNVCLVPPFGEIFGSLVFAILFIVLCWSIAHILYKKKIYIKI